MNWPTLEPLIIPASETFNEGSIFGDIAMRIFQGLGNIKNNCKGNTVGRGFDFLVP